MRPPARLLLAVALAGAPVLAREQTFPLEVPLGKEFGQYVDVPVDRPGELVVEVEWSACIGQIAKIAIKELRKTLSQKEELWNHSDEIGDKPHPDYDAYARLVHWSIPHPTLASKKAVASQPHVGSNIAPGTPAKKLARPINRTARPLNSVASMQAK